MLVHTEMRGDVDYAEARHSWLTWVRETLQGPKAGEDEESKFSPLKRYCSGILMPSTADLRSTANGVPLEDEGPLPTDPGSTDLTDDISG